MADLIQISTGLGPRVVEGCEVRPGLAVTQTSGGWTLTHTLSGRRLSSYGPMCRRHATAAAEGSRIDWQRERHVLAADPEFWRFVAAVDRAVEACTGDCP